MILYHMSQVIVDFPDINHSRNNLDFGRGFYVTALKNQALNYGKRFSKLNKPAILNIYETGFELMSPRLCEIGELTVLSYPEYTPEWLDYVVSCRKGIDSSAVDVVIGPIADDKVFDTVELFTSDFIDKKEALRRLSFEHPNHQVCFKTQKAIDEGLSFVSFEEVEYE